MPYGRILGEVCQPSNAENLSVATDEPCRGYAVYAHAVISRFDKGCASAGDAEENKNMGVPRFIAATCTST